MFKCIPFVFCLVVAWDVITDFASEILEKVSRCAAVYEFKLSNMCPVSQDHHDELTEILDRKKKETLAQKRSFFVRMVSDPKIYNPTINKAATPRLSHEMQTPVADGLPMIQTPSDR